MLSENLDSIAVRRVWDVKANFRIKQFIVYPSHTSEINSLSFIEFYLNSELRLNSRGKRNPKKVYWKTVTKVTYASWSHLNLCDLVKYSFCFYEYQFNISSQQIRIRVIGTRLHTLSSCMWRIENRFPVNHHQLWTSTYIYICTSLSLHSHSFCYINLMGFSNYK